MSQAKTILIVDDDSEVRNALKKILTLSPTAELVARGVSLFAPEAAPAALNEVAETVYHLLFAESGETAVTRVTEALANGRPVALAFIDMKMPGLNGAETAQAIWHLDPRVKAVFVTAYSEATPREIIETTGRRDHFYLRKPFNGEVIRQFALALTDQWQLEREREELDAELKRKNRELEELNETLEEQVKVQSAMLFQSEKMASIGILAAGVAHEINNPIGFIHSNLETFAGYSDTFKELFKGYQALAAAVAAGRLDEAVSQIEVLRLKEEAEQTAFIFDDIGEMITESLEGSTRISNIVKSLRYISRDDQGTRVYVDINKLLDSILTIIDHQLAGRIELHKQYSQLPEVVCFPQNLSQVFMQILLNAVQAIETSGTITITTREVVGDRQPRGNRVVIIITDDGCGITEDNQKKVFDPFFTTREVGAGIGLGMSVSHDIVKAHQGSIRVTSEVGAGTTITVQLPVEAKGTLNSER